MTLPNDETGGAGPRETTRLPRRVVLKWFAAAAAALHLPEIPARADVVTAKGYGSDPDLSKFYSPGDFWPLKFTPEQRRTAAVLADLILPADHLGPAASEVHVPEFIDEWVSAPYALQQKDRDVILPGLEWLDAEAQRRFQGGFASLTLEQQRAIADDICWPADAKPEFKKAASFFTKFRALSASAYYGTDAGWKAIGYIGNVPLALYDGPPPEVLTQLGIEQTVKDPQA